MELLEAKSESERQLAIDIILENNLPVSDIDESKSLFLFKEDGQVVGTAGLEIYPGCALLRSVSVLKSKQGKGYGKRISTEMEKLVAATGLSTLYLLTMNAADFFKPIGYEIISRDETPESIQHSSQFSSVCPSSAIVMKKRIA